MSIKLMTAVWESDLGPATVRLVALALADSANDEGVCWPAMSTLARKAGCGLSTAREACAKLEADGILHRTLRPVEKGRNDSNLYRLDVQAITPSHQNPAGGAAEIRREVPPEPGGSPAEIRRGNRNLNRKKEPKERADARPDAEQLDPVPVEAVSEPADSGQKAEDESQIDRAYRIWRAAVEETGHTGFVPGADSVRPQIKYFAGRLDVDQRALFEACSAAGSRRSVNLHRYYRPAPITGDRLNKIAVAVAQQVYDDRHGEINFGQILARTKVALRAGRDPDVVRRAILRLIAARKPVTQQLLAEYCETIQGEIERGEAALGEVQRA